MNGLPLIIGSSDDPHVQAVSAAVQRSGFSVRVANVTDEESSQSWRPHTADSQGVRGWIRRLAPAGWGVGAERESVASAVASAKLAQMSFTLYDSKVTWLTRFTDLLRAENKMIQLESAMLALVPIPDTLVTTDVVTLRQWRRGEVVVKPLAAASFLDEGGVRKHVPASLVTTEELQQRDVTEAPFIYQELIRAVSHLRVVTVTGQAWVAELDANICDGIDWRLTDSAHDSFSDVTAREAGLAKSAVRLAAQMSLGFSSQDWVRDETGQTYFLDMNPSGQWMFLPEAITRAVAQAIATFLTGD